MNNKDWDDSLKDRLDDFRPDDLKPDFEAFSAYMQEHEMLEELTHEADFEDNLRHDLTNYNAPGEIRGWERIEDSLKADAQFDDDVRERVREFKPVYQPNTWPMLRSRISGLGYLRSKIITFKIVEVAAVLLLLFTALKMGQMGKLPFDIPGQPPYQKSQDSPGQDRAGISDPNSANHHDIASASALQHPNDLLDTPGKEESVPNTGTIPASSDNSSLNRQHSTKTSSANLLRTPGDKNIAAISKESASNESGPSKSIAAAEIRSEADPLIQSIASSIQPVIHAEIQTASNEIESITEPFADAIAYNTSEEKVHDHVAVDFMATFPSLLQWNKNPFLPSPKYVRQKATTYTEFGIVSQLDYNRMNMPEDRLYSAGKAITFPEQGLPGTSMGYGFTLALGHPRWAVETGIIYGSKSFRPGRHLVVGNAFENGSVEFEAMRLQLVTIPVQYRYRIDHKGPFRFYALAGFGLHLIAQSDIDVLIKYHFPSLSYGENPNNDPDLANTIRETRRVSEHIRDGAPFSTKSFLSVNGGIGCEFALAGHKTIFLQTSAQYQVPNLEFSNNNGKHIRSVSIQGGVRTPIGK